VGVRRRPHVLQTVAVLAVVMALLLWLLTGCATPSAFVAGAVVSPPAGCTDARERGHEC